MNAPLRRSRPYIFWGQTQSLCEICLALVPAKIEIVGEEVWYEKRCRQHGVQSTLLSRHEPSAQWSSRRAMFFPCQRETAHREI